MKCRERIARRLILAALGLGAGCLPAHANLRVCNNTHMLINFAIGYNAGDRFVTEGWWTMTPGSCSTPWRGALPGRFTYLYATDIDGVDVLSGGVSMCVDRVKFKIYGVGDCWRRGLQAVNFAEIDAGASPDWTTFLNDGRK